jgi:hypothetical protein
MSPIAADTALGVARFTFRLVPPSVIVGKLVPLQVVTVGVAQRPEPAILIAIGVPAAVVLVSTDEMLGAALTADAAKMLVIAAVSAAVRDPRP